jgi:uncharacterized membrane protein
MPEPGRLANPAMKRPRKRWFKHTSWTIPLAYVAAAVILGMVLPRLEHYVLPRSVSTVSAASGMAICSAIASGMISLTGIVFSLTFVMIQFSATAYSPRLVLWVARDPVMSHALGMFSATFLYALILLSWVDRETLGKVPLMSGFLVFALLLASMGMFIALIQRVSLLQVNRMLIFTGNQGRQAIAELYSATLPPSSAAEATAPRDWPITQTLCHVGRPQVMQAIHIDGLVELATAADAVIEVMVTVGDTVLELTPLLRVHGARQSVAETALKNALELGNERTFEQDPKYALRLVVDIALKALYPAINDPTTAVQALDQIEDLLLRLGQCQLDIGAFPDPTGKLRLIAPFPTWDDFLRLALDETCACGANSVQVMRRMKALIQNLTAVLPPGRHAALQHWAKRLQGSVNRSFPDAEEKRDASVADRQGLGIGQEGASAAR